MIPALITAGATILGGLLGSKNKAPTTTDKKEPWAPAQPYLTENLAANKQLQDWYRQNPFNAQQRQGYQNLFADQDNFRGNVAPGLMQFANNMMGSNYQRKAVDRPGGAAGYTGGLLGPAQPQQAQQAPQTGLLGGPFSVARQTAYGPIDWNAQNPFYKSPEQLAEAARLAEEDRLRQLAAQQQQAPQFDQSASSNWNAGYGA